MTNFIGGVDFHELRSKRVKNYDTVSLALDAAVTDKEFIFTGNYIYIAEATDIDVNISIRFCEQSRAAIKMVHGRAVRTPFYRLYLSWAAQPGKSVVLAMGVGEENLFEILDIGKALELSGEVTVEDTKRTEVFNEKHGAGVQSRLGQTLDRGCVCLWNPADSGVSAYIYAIGAWQDAIRLAYIYNITAWEAGNWASGNKKVESRFPECHLWTVSCTYDEFVYNYMSGTCLNLDRFDPVVEPGKRSYSAPFCITPGFGLAAYTEEDAKTAYVAFEWYEKTI